MITQRFLVAQQTNIKLTISFATECTLHRKYCGFSDNPLWHIMNLHKGEKWTRNSTSLMYIAIYNADDAVHT
jgi:hypothetical protein